MRVKNKKNKKKKKKKENKKKEVEARKKEREREKCKENRKRNKSRSSLRRREKRNTSENKGHSRWKDSTARQEKTSSREVGRNGNHRSCGRTSWNSERRGEQSPGITDETEEGEECRERVRVEGREAFDRKKAPAEVQLKRGSVFFARRDSEQGGCSVKTQEEREEEKCARGARVVETRGRGEREEEAEHDV